MDRSRIDQIVLQNMSEAIYVRDFDMNVLYINPASEGLTGWSLAEAQGKKCYEIFGDEHAACRRVCPVDKAISERSHILHHEGELKTRTGEVHRMRVSISPFYEGEKPLGAIVVMGDITRLREFEQTHAKTVIAQEKEIESHKRAVDSLARTNKMLLALTKAQTQFMSKAAPRDIFGNLLDILLSLTDSECGFIGEVLYTGEGVPYLKTQVISNIAWSEETCKLYEKQAPQGLEFYNLNTLFGSVITTGKPVISNDPASDPRRGCLPDGHPEIRAFLGLPFHDETQLVGMVGIANRPGGYDEEMVDFLRPYLLTCQSIITACRNERLRRETEHALRMSEAQYRSVVEDQTELISRCRPDGTLTFVNGAFCRFFDRNSEELFGQSHFSFILEEDRERVVRELASFSAEKPVLTSEHRLIAPNGRIRWVRRNCRAVFDDKGKVVEFQSVGRDITDLKHAEEVVRASRKLAVGLSSTSNLKEALDLCPQTALDISGLDAGGIYLADDDLSLVLVNHAGLSEEFIREISYYAPDSPEALLVREGRLRYCCCEETVAGTVDKAKKDGLRSIVAIPVVHNGRIVACFNMGSHVVDDVPAETIQALEMIAGEIGSAIARIRAENLARENEANLQALFNTMEDFLFVVDLDSSILQVNPAVRNRLGYSIEETSRMKIPDFHPPDRREEAGLIIAEILSGSRAQCEIPLMAGDGRLIPVETKVVRGRWAGKDVLFGVSRDVSDRKKAEDALRASEERYRTLVDLAPDGIGVHSLGKVVFANRSLARFLGGTPEDIIGRTALDLAHPDYRDLVRARIGRMKETGKPAPLVEEKWLRLDGTPIDVEVIASPIVYDGAQAFQVLARDITERKQMQALQLQMARSGALADLAHGVAHNFNNLLQVVIGYLELALSDLKAGNLTQVEPTLKRILHESRAGAETVRRLQTYAGLRDLAKRDEVAVFDLADVVRQAIEIARTWWKTTPEKLGMEVSLNTKLAECCLVEGERNRLFDVVVNLLKNACEAVIASPGGEIEIHTSVRDNEVLLAVRDTGVGISEENLSRVFNPFFTTKSKGGAGLGLATSRKTVEEHGGQIVVDSKEREGATFTVRLPLAREIPEPAMVEAKPSVAAQLTILAVDDEPSITSLIQRWFARHGHTTLTAASGQEALKIFEENPVDAVICDLGMPGMNGWQVGKRIHEICEQRGMPKIPFVILTGWGGQRMEEEEMEKSSVDLVVEKPLDLDKMVDIIRDLTRSASKKGSRA